MSKRHMRWISLVGAVLGAALLLTASGFAAFSPSFTVSTDPSGTTVISYQQGSSDDTVGAMSLYVPADVFANVSQPPGLAVGKATATVGGAKLTGTIAAAAGTDVAPNGTATFAASAAGCSGNPSAPAAFWLLNLTGGGQTVALAVYLYNVLETDPYGSFFIASLSICPPSSMKLTGLSLAVAEVFSVTPSWDIWHLRAVPYATGGTTLNAAGAVEAEAQDRTPHEVTANAKKGKAAGTVTVAGKVKQGGIGLPGMTVNVLAGKKIVGTGKTKVGGKYTIVAKTRARNVVAQATVPDRPLPKCVQPLFAPAPCTSATISGFVGSSDPAAVA